MTPPKDPNRSPRRSRRPPRKSAVSASSPMLSPQDTELSTDTGTEKSVRPKRILQRGDSDALSDFAPIVKPENPPPHTPPRPKSMYAGSAEKQQPRSGSALGKSQNKRNPSKVQGRNQSGQASPVPMANSTLTPTPRRDLTTPRRDSATPNRAAENPSKAYAGPTFHASPAASSLPMPKFYSKSVPNVDKTKSLKTMMEQDAPDSSSGSEGSPALEHAEITTNPRARGESPLDIFFRADREAKSRTSSVPNAVYAPSGEGNRLSSRSATQASDPPHSRNASVGGMFAMEMDGGSPDLSSGLSLHAKSPTMTSDLAASESPGLTDEEREQRRKAQTIALKKLLYSPRPRILHNNSAGHRPPSSKLRKEISMPTSPEQTETLELPTTPTPSRAPRSTTVANDYKKEQDGYVPPNALNTSKPKTKSEERCNVSMDDTTRSRSIEDDLRRILKLDALGSNSVLG